MSDPQAFTAQQAADPATPAQTLADIAAQRPDLRAALASNPSTYQALLDWLAELGDPAVDAALAARGGGAPAVPVQPAAPQQPEAGYQTWSQTTPEQPQTGQPQPGQPQPGWQPAPGQPWQSSPAQPWQQPSGPPQAGAWQPAGGQPGGPQQWQSYGSPPPKKKGNTALIVVLVLVGVLVVLGAGAFFALRALGDRIGEQVVGEGSITYSTTGNTQDSPPGDDPALDSLWLACQAEDWGACDQLFDESPVDSVYESYGGTCGYRTDGQSYCTDEFGG